MISKPSPNARVGQRQVKAASRRLERAAMRVQVNPTDAQSVWWAAREAQEAYLYLRDALWLG